MSSNTPTLIDRYKGALIGLAVGDALGTTLEFSLPGTFTPITNMVGGGPFNLEAGKWTDDTSMALCMAVSLTQKECFDPEDQMLRYCNWHRHGYYSSLDHCFDIGNATYNALSKFERTKDPFAGSTDPRSAGNGSLMRLAPTPMFFYPDYEEMIHHADLSSKTTHAAPQAVAACRYFAYLLALAFDGESKETILKDYSTHPLMETGMDDLILDIVKGSYKEFSPPRIAGTGYVVRTLEAVLWAFYHSNTFEEGALKVVNLGDDADTTGAIYGQLAGAYYGFENIPTKWREKLYMSQEIETMAELLLKLAQARIEKA